MSKKRAQKVALGAVIIFIAAVAGLYWLGSQETKNEKALKSPTPSEQTINNSAGLSGGEISSWKTYKNEQYGFELKYPQDWFIFEGDIGENRVYIQSAPGKVSKETAPDNFRRIWIAYASEEGEEILSNLIGADKYVAVNSGITMNYYSWPSRNADEEESLRVYWINNSDWYMATAASEVGNNNSKEEVGILKQILTTFKFSK